MQSTLRTLCEHDIDLGLGPTRFFSLPQLEKEGGHAIARLPLSLRIVLESLLRNCDGHKVTEGHVCDLAAWRGRAPRDGEIPFIVGRVVLNCAAGIPLLGDLTAMRSAVSKLGLPVDNIGPKVPIDMVLDHTLTVDHHGSSDALELNMALENERNAERFSFVKWAMQAYDGIRLFPPGAGILHQINLEVLANGFLLKDGVCFPDTLVGTDSHTGMIAGLGVVGWGVGGIEVEAAALAQPIYFLTPDVVGVNVIGRLRSGVTSTDLVLHVTELLRRSKVVGKFVEFFGEGVKNLTIPDRATISNMAPEYGATIGYFPVDEHTCHYLRLTGRSEAQVLATEAFFRAQGCFGAPALGEIDYTTVIDLDLENVEPNVAGPKRPQDRIRLPELGKTFREWLARPAAAGGYGVTQSPAAAKAAKGDDRDVSHGDVAIAAITSCTNTSNPTVMLTAGLLAKHAVERGLKVKPWVKTSLTPGSRVVTKYLTASGLQPSLDALGFNAVGYSCGTCVGASGPIDRHIDESILSNQIVAAAVLSGNRNFEGRIHPAVKAAFLASPPLVVAFALAGTVNIDLEIDPLGIGTSGETVYLRDIWPTPEEIEGALCIASQQGFYREVYGTDLNAGSGGWQVITHAKGEVFPWNENSTYVKEPPFLEPEFHVSCLSSVIGSRVLAVLGDSVTTDHISPIGNIKASSPAGLYLQNLGVKPTDFNNYGARRMNHEVMVRGGFSNVRLKNLMVPDVEGGVTPHQPDGTIMSIYDAAMRYRAEGVPLIVIAGEEYGIGSARDWAAKATRLLGVRAVIASSFERIHRSNLVGMGVLPCQFLPNENAANYKLDGSERFDLIGFDEPIKPGHPLLLIVHRRNGTADHISLTLRLDTPTEVDCAKAGGIMSFILSELTSYPEAALARTN